MTDKLIYAILGITVGGLLALILRPSVDPIAYPEIIVHEIRGEPDTVRTFVDRIVFRDRKPDLVVTQPSGGEDVVSDFCHPDTVEVVAGTDTLWLPTDTVFLMRSVDTSEPWFFGRSDVTVWGPNSVGDLQELRYRSWPGWSLRTHPDLIFREPRLGWIKPIIEYGSVATFFYFLGSWIGGE